MTKLSIEECLQTGWELFKKRSWFFIGIAAFLIAMSFVSNIINSSLSSYNGFMPSVIGFIISLAFSIYISFGQTRFFIRAHDAADQVRFSDLWSTEKLMKFVVLYVGLAIGVIVGLILFILPGIYFSLISMFSIFAFLDSDRTPMEAFQESRRITKGHLLELFLFALALLLLNILGAIALLVGLLVTIPISLLATVHAYRSLERIASKPVEPSVA